MSAIKPVRKRRRSLAKGSLDDAGRFTVAVRLDVDTFCDVRGLAAECHISFAEQVRRLVISGLERVIQRAA